MLIDCETTLNQLHRHFNERGSMADNGVMAFARDLTFRWCYLRRQAFHARKVDDDTGVSISSGE